MDCPLRNSPSLRDFCLQDPTWVTLFFWPHICFVTNTSWPAALGIHVHSEHSYILGNFRVHMFVLDTNKRTNKNFISLVILGEYVRKTLGKLLVPNFSFLTWGNWSPVSLMCFPLNFWSHLVTELQLQIRLSSSASTSKGGLPVTMATIFLMRLTCSSPIDSSETNPRTQAPASCFLQARGRCCDRAHPGSGGHER